MGGAFLANYISEKLVGYVGGALFLVFACLSAKKSLGTPNDIKTLSFHLLSDP
jgi:hypothetical protein